MPVPVWMAALVIYLLIINLAAVIITVLDKSRAQKKKWRIPEATLLLMAAMGGSPAMYITMHSIRHKTRKAKFMVGIPIILVLQIGLIVALQWRFSLFTL